MKFIALVFLLICHSLSAEVYKDFVPYITVAKMKSNYPNANFEVVKAAWVKENDLFFKVTGQGLSGTTYIATYKRPDSEVKEAIENYKKKIEENQNGNNAVWQAMIEMEDEYLVAPLDEKYTIHWLRWVPDDPIPIERLISKFGKPDVYDFQEEDFQPYAQWLKRGLLTTLSDDKKRVFTIQYTFTDEDYNRALGINNKPAVVSKPNNKSKPKKTSM